MTFHLYRDHKREYRWRLKAKNGRIIAESGEGYKRKLTARLAIDALLMAVIRENYELEERG